MPTIGVISSNTFDMELDNKVENAILYYQFREHIIFYSTKTTKSLEHYSPLNVL